MIAIKHPLANPPADKKALYPHVVKNYIVNWFAIRRHTIECHYRHLSDISSLNKGRLYKHRINESPWLLRAHREAYIRCYVDKRLVFHLELARQIRRLLKGPKREEYKLRMVDGRDVTRSRVRARKAAPEGLHAEVWRDRLRPRVKREL